MSSKHLELDNYIASLCVTKKEWMLYFVNYMRTNHPDIEELISFKMPTYKLGSGKMRNYIAFSLAEKHFSLHSMDFEYIGELKKQLEKPGKGKGCVNVNYANLAERNVLINGIEEIIRRKVLATYENK